jgi:acyl-coenzyme A synthetase/AMP-(fatty) acid ligase
VRMGTAEIYRAVLAIDDVVDALVVDVPPPASARLASSLATSGPGRSHTAGTDGWMPLFVVLRDGVSLDDSLVQESAGGSAKTVRPATSRTRSARSARCHARSPGRPWRSR